MSQFFGLSKTRSVLNYCGENIGRAKVTRSLGHF